MQISAELSWDADSQVSESEVSASHSWSPRSHPPRLRRSSGPPFSLPAADANYDTRAMANRPPKSIVNMARDSTSRPNKTSQSWESVLVSTTSTSSIWVKVGVMKNTRYTSYTFSCALPEGETTERRPMGLSRIPRQAAPYAICRSPLPRCRSGPGSGVSLVAVASRGRQTIPLLREGLFRGPTPRYD